MAPLRVDFFTKNASSWHARIRCRFPEWVCWSETNFSSSFRFQESMYHPQVEAISPTGPEATGERDDLKAIKEDLLKKITKVDREILKAESQIVKLKKKQQELEDAANKPFSDSSDEMERPKNQSVAQVIYADNRVSLGRFYVNRPSIEFIQLASLCRLFRFTNSQSKEYMPVTVQRLYLPCRSVCCFRPYWGPWELMIT